MQAPNTPFTKSHIPCPLSRLYQTISPGPRQMYPIRNKASFYGEELLATRQPPSWRTSPCRLPKMLIQYTHRCPPYWKPFLYPQPEDAPCRGDRDPLDTTLHGQWYSTSMWIFILIYISTKVYLSKRNTYD